MPKVAVAIPTFRRPKGLARLLDALAQLETSADVEIVVADNDAALHEGAKLCERLSRKYRWPLTAVIVSERGIAQARNALVEHVLAHSSAEYIAMLDDDEWPSAGWLDAFLRTQRETKADALRGTILREFESAPGKWAAQLQGMAPVRARSGPVDMIDGAGNVLIARACFEGLSKPYFDPGFALTGGEDRDFFTRLRRQEWRFAWAGDAVCTEFVPASRANLAWALMRAYRIGNSDMRVFLKYRPAQTEKFREGVKIAGAILLYPLWQIALAPIPQRRAEPLCKLYRAAGKIAAIFGRHYNEYAAVHGG